MIKHLLSIDQLSVEQIELVLKTADGFREVGARTIKKVPTLRGRTVCNLFFEPSTRTRISFELAAKRLSADVINFTSGPKTSISKGESFKDTALTLQAMGVDAIVVRHSSSGAAQRLSQWVDGSVINAGDGAHEHPTQALLDLYSIRERFDSLEGLRIGIVGDIVHSRVARSNVKAFSKMGAQVIVVGPSTLLPPSIAGWGAEASTELDQVLPKLDVVYLLRVQTERQREQLFPSIREYARFWGLDSRRVQAMKPEALLMHPGPMNRGVEISSDLAESGRSIITNQVTNGIAVRAAVLYLMLGSQEPQHASLLEQTAVG
jgi:aspartate carbamoyltransferase catalytic subunit